MANCIARLRGVLNIENFNSELNRVTESANWIENIIYCNLFKALLESHIHIVEERKNIYHRAPT